MINQDTTSLVNWTLLSGVLNCLFVGHGTLLVSNADLLSGIGIVAAAAIGYGSSNLVLWCAAWITPSRGVLIVAILLATAFAVFLLVVGFRLNVVWSFEGLAGIVLLIAFLSVNGLIIRRVASRR